MDSKEEEINICKYGAASALIVCNMQPQIFIGKDIIK